MMSYNDFLEEFRTVFMEYAERTKAELSLEFTTLDRINERRDAFIVRYGDALVSPVIYTENLYNEYLYGQTVYEIAFKAHAALGEAMRNTGELYENAGYTNPECLYAAVVNTKLNREILKDIPHKEIGDLSVIAKYRVAENANYMIQNSHAVKFRMTPEEILEQACSNTLEQGFQVSDMSAVIAELTGEELMEDSLPMYVVSNDRRVDGAAAIMDKTWMNELTERLGENIYILPSSRHEMIAVPESQVDNPDYLRAMVSEVNQAVVSGQDFLSDSVYHYDAEQEILRVIREDRDIADEMVSAVQKHCEIEITK